MFLASEDRLVVCLCIDTGKGVCSITITRAHAKSNHRDHSEAFFNLDTLG